MKIKRFTSKREATKFALSKLLDGATVKVYMSGLQALDGRDKKGGYIVRWRCN